MDDVTMYGAQSIMFQALIINKTGSSQECKLIQPKGPTYHLKAKVQFNETTPDGHLEGFINIVRKHVFYSNRLGTHNAGADRCCQKIISTLYFWKTRIERDVV
jgi:hypothetical protein